LLVVAVVATHIKTVVIRLAVAVQVVIAPLLEHLVAEQVQNLL
jgi:hypothetical protein